MTHSILNENGKHIHGDILLDEIKYMITKHLEYAYINGKKLSVVSDRGNQDERITVIRIEDAD